MYAIVDIAGKQYKIEKNKFIYTDKLAGNEGDKIEFGNVLMIGNDGQIDIGAPLLKGAKISGTILGQVKGDKVISFKKKRRKGFRKTIGHRRQLTKVLIDSISK
jgi:large subunit ribosomal protein L21